MVYENLEVEELVKNEIMKCPAEDDENYNQNRGGSSRSKTTRATE